MKAAFHCLVVTLTLAFNGLAELIVDQVPPSLLTAPGTTNVVRTLPARTTHATRKPPVTAGERWERFDAEFGIKQKETALVKSSLQSAKYQLDQTTFAVQEFVHNVEELLRFDYGVRDIVPLPVEERRDYGSSGNLLLDTLNATRLKSDVDLKLTGRQFIGVKLVLPLGD